MGNKKLTPAEQRAWAELARAARHLREAQRRARYRREQRRQAREVSSEPRD